MGPSSKERPVIIVSDHPAELQQLVDAFAQCKVENPRLIATKTHTLFRFLEEIPLPIFPDETYLPRLIILDFDLSTGEAPEILQRLKHHTMFARIPVIVLARDPRDEEESVSLGCDDFRIKPSKNQSYYLFVRAIRSKWLTINTNA